MIRLLAIFAVLAGSVWVGLGTVVVLDLFPSVTALRQIARLIAYGLTAIAAIIAVSVLILDLALPSLFSIRPSGLFRTIVTASVTFVVTGGLLSWLGFDLGAILTTSAILGAVIGLALQPTLGSLVAGMALTSVRNLKPGSFLAINDMIFQVESTHWRHIKGRAPDNSEVFIPNALLAQSLFTIFPEDRAARFDVFLHLPPDVPPQQITDALTGAFTDVEQLDATMPVQVVPWETRPDLGSIVYRIRLWARDHDLIFDLKGEVLRRAWYVLDRIGVHQPRNWLFDRSGWQGPSLREALVKACPELNGNETDRMAAVAIQHRFAPMEILRFPPAEVGRVVLILQGQVSRGTDHFLNPVEYGLTSVPNLPTIPSKQLSEAAILRQIADRLAQEVGPVSEQLMRTAIQTSPDRSVFLDRLAEHIADETARDAFRAETRDLVLSNSGLGPGTTAALVKDATGTIGTRPGLRAMTEVLLVSLPEDLAADLYRAVADQR